MPVAENYDLSDFSDSERSDIRLMSDANYATYFLAKCK